MDTPSKEPDSSSSSGTCLLPLKHLLSSLSHFLTSLKPRRTSQSEPPSNKSSRSGSTTASITTPLPSPHRYGQDCRPPSPYPPSHGTPTFLALPRPKPNRFRDHASEIDFDMLGPPATARLPSRGPSPTTFMFFSNFTTSFTVPPFDREVEGGRPRSAMGLGGRARAKGKARMEEGGLGIAM